MDNSPGQRRIAVVLLLSMTVLGVFPLDVVLPSFPALSEHFRTAPADIALSVSLFAVGIALSQLLIGPLSDVIGRKHLLLAGIAIAMVGALGCTLATNYSVFLVMRFVQALGCGSTIARPAATTQAMGLFPENAGTSASAGSTLIFICGGLISAVVSLSSFELALTLGFSFIALSGTALLLNRHINRRAKGRRAGTTSE
jgi:DHA1 family bicyclomycin/chloramphenicol resistance-like MFS transporter